MRIRSIKDIASLVPDLRNGKETAFDQIFTHFYSPLCFFANRILLDDKTATEDIVQEIMLKLWEKRSDFEAFDAVKSFLYVSVRNACFNLLDKQKVKQKHYDHITTSNILAEETILQTIVQAEVVRQIAAVVDTLPGQCRKVIRMIYEEGMKPKKIADELGITVSTVNNQKKRGLSLLKDRMSDQDFSVAVLLLLPFFNSHL